MLPFDELLISDACLLHGHGAICHPAARAETLHNRSFYYDRMQEHEECRPALSVYSAHGV